MSINTIIGDNLIACTNLNAKLVPGLAVPADKGPIPSAADLGQIAQCVEVSNLTPAPGADTSHARPTMLASISSFVENVKAAWNALAPGADPAAYENLPSHTKRDYIEWRGMIAGVALCNIYSGMGLKLSVNEMDLEASGNAAIRCVLLEMEKDATYRAAVTEDKGKLFYICQKGTPFAIFHPEIGLCPMKEYDPAIFDGVLPWYEKNEEDCHAGWKPDYEWDDFDLQRIAWWVNANDMLTYNAYMKYKLGGVPVLSEMLAAEDSVANANSVDAVWPGKGTAFGTTMMAYLDAAGKAYPMPDLFLNTMMISSIGDSKNNRMVFNTAGGPQKLCFAEGKLSAYVPVPPFKRDIMNLMKSCTFESLVFQAELDGKGQLTAVKVEVVVNTPAGQFKTGKTYGYDKLCLGRMPYLMLWPFLPMPSGKQLWKSYYATWHDQTQALRLLIGANGKPITLVEQELSYDWEDQGNTYMVFRPTAADQVWPVCVGDGAFQYAVLTGMDAITGDVTDMGLVFMPTCPSQPVTKRKQGTVTLAVDFGTTSTVCALKSSQFEGKTEITLPFLDYSRCVTCEDENARIVVNSMHWLGSKEGGENWQWSEKLFSVAQLFEQAPPVINRQMLPQAKDQKYYVDGRLFLFSDDVMVSLAKEARDNADPLKAQQIINDMKFNDGLDVKNYHAASIYLAGVYMYAVLYLLRQGFVPAPGTPYVDLRVSYPNDVTKGALLDNWNNAEAILNRIMDPELTAPIHAMRMYTEATAAAAYQIAHAPATFENTLVSLDIGGGTTDISISDKTFHKEDVRNLSVRYAGREIMVSSLVEFYRKQNPEVPAIIDGNAFANLWSEQNAEAASLYNSFAMFCQPTDGNASIPFLHGLTNNSTLRMSVETLLAKGMRMDSASDLNATNLPRQLIAMKFIMLMHVVARSVRENIDMWKDPRGNFILIGKKLDINLSVSGTSAQLLQYVFDCSMGDLVQLMTPDVLSPASPMAQCLNLMNTIFDEALRDVLAEDVHTSLRIHVAPDVAQKRDVSYGMLDANIDNLTPKMPVTVGALVPGFAAPSETHKGMDEAERKRKKAEKQMELAMYSTDELDAYIGGVKDKNGNVTRHGMMDYWKWYESIYFPAPTKTNRGLGQNVSVMSSLMEPENYIPHFANAKAEVAKTRAAYMIEPEQAPYLDLITGMYMVEELLDWEIAMRQ